ncbi:MAG: NifU family protein [Deltaproteobacteria bacterium]|jgi:Fe-S cluster biogenesis protein NfuA|nr:NifU family protein [Deltaproteobacteria bacterium]
MTKDQVEAVLGKIRPMLQADGGNIELVDVNEGVVSVRLVGACCGCPMSQMTLKNGVEQALRDSFPDLKELVSVPA